MGEAMSYQHAALANGRWTSLSFAEQMANVGSEVSRALNWKKKNRGDYARKAACRALELLSLTVDATTVASRYKELTRLQEALVDYFWGNNQFSSTEILWRKYFDHFNFLCRRNI